jgi:hypothetical protein
MGKPMKTQVSYAVPEFQRGKTHGNHGGSRYVLVGPRVNCLPAVRVRWKQWCDECKATSIVDVTAEIAALLSSISLLPPSL